MATSISLDKSKYGADYINDGVQGASPVFYNTYAMFDKLGFKASPVGMQVSFGREPDADFWSNVFPSRVIDRFVLPISHTSDDTNSFLRFRSDIQKFGRVLKVIKALEPLFAVVSVDAMLRMFRFSQACPSPPYPLFAPPTDHITRTLEKSSSILSSPSSSVQATKPPLYPVRY